jgi:hypothetical protein
MLPGRPTDPEVVAGVRRVAAAPDFWAHDRCQEYFRALGWDLESVAELLCECDDDALFDHGPDRDPDRPDCYIAELEILGGGETIPFYLKVVLVLPEMVSGYLLSIRLRPR